MTIIREKAGNSEYRGQVNIRLICKDDSELTAMCKALDNWECDFEEEEDDGVSITFFMASDEVEDFKQDYKLAKKSIK